ncbi:hypothetical protein [Thiosulfativibrio zosterae]|uniref:Lipoprotein n=1 Tax=Thiosulfativibrio zosterae TaxID=2675053 RepID=A0A6F8PJL9_9GAMM|nr:hypothetical protein [Thiosulfativibrio zosterae]BBP42268.1 hypothetical protein THMIRHAT_00140 [Thiosulfativibrio zosterae]
MKKIISLAALFAVFASVTACAPANVSSNLRASSSQESSMATRCVDFTTGDEEEVNELLKKYDGWKVAYASEYTTSNKSTTSMVMCFEKPYK